MRKVSGKLHLNSPLPGGESRTETPEVVHRVQLRVPATSQPDGWTILSLVDVLSVVYALLLVTLSIVLPLCLFLAPELNYHHHGAFLTVFHYYMYLGALGVLVYMMVSGRLVARKGKVTHLTMGKVPLPEGQEAPLLYEGIEEVNFFLRLGLVAFSIGGGLMEGFRVMSYVERDSALMWHCFGPAYLVLSVIRLLFLVMQTFALFKYHRIVINYHHAVMKVCTMHLIAANLCTWSLTVILEAVESYHHNEALKSGHRRRAAPAPEDHGPINDTTLHGTPKCSATPSTLSTVAAPYLFPFIIEYSLLAAAILYNINTRIGPEEYKEVEELMEEKKEEKKLLQQENSATGPQHNESLFDGASCSKAHSGLFMGLIVFIALAVASCFFLYIKASNGGPSSVTGLIHITSDIVVNVIALLGIVLAFHKTHKLFFTAHLDNMLDQNLLVLALFGYYGLLSCMAIAALAQTTAQPPLKGQGARLIGAMCIIDLIQISLQVLFIVDGLRRRAVNDYQATHKPGRSLVTFLLVLNLGLWLINTFMLKESYSFSIFYGFYGDLAWIIILNLTLPLAIYFRFHAAVCLSEIWLHAYKKVSMHRIIEQNIAHCGKIL